VISGRTNTVTATVPVGLAPLGVAANPKTNTAYIANSGSATVSLLSPCPTLPFQGEGGTPASLVAH
jgi:DNA-binding beta-propeller fold protein YncE